MYCTIFKCIVRGGLMVMMMLTMIVVMMMIKTVMASIIIANDDTNIYVFDNFNQITISIFTMLTGLFLF